MRRVHLLVLLLLSIGAVSQNIVEGEIRGFAKGRLLLMSIYGERTRAIDSTLTDSLGHFRFTLVNRLPGIYRVWWTKEEYVDLVWNQENIRFTTGAASSSDSLSILSSIENIIYQAYTRLDRMNQEKLQLLLPVVDFYPEKDSFYASVVNQMEMIQKNQERFVDSLTRQYPSSYSMRMIRSLQSPYIPVAMGKEDRTTFLKQHFFDRVDFSDTSLLRSQVFVNKAIAYLSLYSNSRYSQKQLEAEFIKAVTVMLGAASVSPEVYKFLLDYLVGGFDKYHFEDVITYIADNFQDPSSCEDQERKSALQKKLDNFKKIATGKIAPALEVPDAKGKMARLSDITSEYTLLVFYASNCGHCAAMMPRLKELYEKQRPKRFEVMAVSIDTSRTEWTGFIREQKLNWINVSDLKGFGGKAADDYNIYATPTMFLLDREKKILSKPISLMELEQTLRDHNLVQ